MTAIKQASCLAALTFFLSNLSAQAQELAVDIEIPRLTVAEYHVPYIAVWIQQSNGQVAANLAVWYDTELKDREGEKWLKDMRQWWRRSGRSLEMPIDGVTGATRPVGVHKLTFEQGKIPLGDLPEGDYRLMIEAAREVGGRELVMVPFQWPVKEAQTLKESGENELGQIQLHLKP